MKILFFGAGVINSLYAWALARAGHEVALLVRPGKEAQWANGLQIDILDERSGKAVAVKDAFKPKVVSQFTAADGYELVIESVKHYQTAEILPLIVPNLGDALLVFFNNNWEGLGFIDKVLPKTKYVLGMPRAGGVIKNGVLDGALTKNVMLGSSVCGASVTPEVAAQAEANFKKVAQVFESAQLHVEAQPNMEHWYWTHFAANAPWIGGGAEARGYVPLASNLGKVYNALCAGREAMAVVQARGVEVTKIGEAQMFMAPPFISALIAFFALRSPVSLKISAGHSAAAAPELHRIFMDVLETGEKLKVPMPRFKAYQPAVEVMKAQAGG